MKRFYLIIFVIGYTYSQNYSYITPTRDGIGKVYMGREISKVMGHMGAPWLERSTREFEERPDLVVNALKLNKTDIVADFGAGSGYFTRRLAPLCSLVYAVDIQKEMIDINQKKMKSLKINNVDFRLGSIKKTNLPKESIDYLIMVDSISGIILTSSSLTPSSFNQRDITTTLTSSVLPDKISLPIITIAAFTFSLVLFIFNNIHNR